MAEKEPISQVKIKDVFAKPEMQNLLQSLLLLPQSLMITKIETKTVFENGEATDKKTQHITGVTLPEKDNVEFDYSGAPLDEKNDVLEFFSVAGVSDIALNSNMYKGNFQGYSPVGFKFVVTELKRKQN
jgi:hypothetical protein